jgi:phage terminase large subunit-like protein
VKTVFEKECDWNTNDFFNFGKTRVERTPDAESIITLTFCPKRVIYDLTFVQITDIARTRLLGLNPLNTMYINLRVLPRNFLNMSSK